MQRPMGWGRCPAVRDWRAVQVLATSKRFLKHAICLADVKLGEKIGEGSFGEVYKGTLYGQEIALKKMRVTQDALKEFKKEVRIMTSVRCTRSCRSVCSWLAAASCVIRTLLSFLALRSTTATTCAS